MQFSISVVFASIEPSQPLFVPSPRFPHSLFGNRSDGRFHRSSSFDLAPLPKETTSTLGPQPRQELSQSHYSPRYHPSHRCIVLPCERYSHQRARSYHGIDPTPASVLSRASSFHSSPFTPATASPLHFEAASSVPSPDYLTPIRTLQQSALTLEVKKERGEKVAWYVGIPFIESSASI